jgi:bacteriocin-like protein
MSDESSTEQAFGDALTDDELSQVVGGGDEGDIKGDITVNPNRS